MHFVSSTVLGAVYETTSSSAYDQILRKTVAVKKISNPFGTVDSARRALREIKLINHLRHGNIISYQDIFISPGEDIYLVTGSPMVDLKTLMRIRDLESDLTQLFAYQILRGLKYIHSAGLAHGDLRPSKLLIDLNCDLKIYDFGVDRPQLPRTTNTETGICYRAPETMTRLVHSAAADIFSTGCILAEMCQTRSCLLSTDTTVELITKMLVSESRKRITAKEALRQPYLMRYHDPADEPVAGEMFDWIFGATDCSEKALKRRMYVSCPHPRSACNFLRFLR
ncbi:kinase-like domain-containing protein [Aspergillus unguis]